MISLDLEIESIHDSLYPILLSNGHLSCDSDQQGRIRGKICREQLGRSRDAKIAEKTPKNKCVTDKPTDQ